MASTWAETGPLQLLRPTEGYSSLEEDPSAAAALQSISGPVTVVSIVGSQRGGKSTLMNLLHGRHLSGFPVGHHLDPKTFGLWVWPRPHPWNKDVTILFMDSEGLDSPHVPVQYHWLLSAVTLLAADVCMYQSRGSIEHSQTQRLEMILAIAEQLGRGRSSELPGDQDKQSDGRLSNFFWLLRDAQLRMQRSPKEELHEKLSPSTLQALKRCFSDCDCVPLPRPVHDNQDLPQLDSLGFDQLAPDFKEEYMIFERRLFELLSKPRTVLGAPLTGANLQGYLQKYLTAIQQKTGLLQDIHHLPTQKDLLMQLAGERAVQSALKAYQAAMSEGGHGTLEASSGDASLNTAKFLRCHLEAQKKAEAAFNSEAEANGLQCDDQKSFAQLCASQIAEWSSDTFTLGRSCQGETLVEDCSEWSAPCVEFDSTVRAGSLQLRHCGRTLKGGALFKLWKRHDHAVAGATNSFALSVSEPLEKRVQATCSRAAQQDTEIAPYREAEELWEELQKLLKEGRELGLLGRSDSSLSGPALLCRGAAAGDRVVLGLARRELDVQTSALQDQLAAAKEQLQALRTAMESGAEQQKAEHAALAFDNKEKLRAMQSELNLQMGNLESQVMRHIAERINVLGQKVNNNDREQTSALQEVRGQLRGVMTEVQSIHPTLQDARSDAEQRLKSCVGELREEAKAAEARLTESQRQAVGNLRTEVMQHTSDRTELLVQRIDNGEKENSCAFQEVRSSLSESASQLRKDLQACESRLSESTQEAVGLAKRVETANQESIGALRSDVQQTISDSKKELVDLQQSTTTELRSVLQTQETALSTLKAETHQKLSELEGQHVQPLAELKSHLEGELRTGFQSQQKAFSAMQVETMQQVHSLAGQHVQPLATLKSGLEEQLRTGLQAQQSALSTMQAETQQQMSVLEGQHAQLFSKAQTTLDSQLRSGLQSQQTALSDLQVETQQQMKTLEGKHAECMSELHTKLEDQLCTGLQTQQAALKALQEATQQQVNALEDQHVQPLAELQSKLEEHVQTGLQAQETALSTLKTETQQQIGELKVQHVQPLADVRSSLEGQLRSALEAQQAALSALQAELQDQVRALDGQHTQPMAELQSRLEVALAAASAERQRMQGTNQQAVMFLSAGAVLSCCNALAISGLAGLQAALLPLIAAGAGYYCASRRSQNWQDVKPLVAQFTERSFAALSQTAESARQKAVSARTAFAECRSSGQWKRPAAVLSSMRAPARDESTAQPIVDVVATRSGDSSIELRLPEEALQENINPSVQVGKSSVEEADCIESPQKRRRMLS